MELEIAYKKKIIAVLSAPFPGAKIYLFGSRARGNHGERSDIDIAIDSGKELPQVDIGEARDMLAESNIPYKIDVVDLHGVPKDMREDILKEGILWKS